MLLGNHEIKLILTWQSTNSTGAGILSITNTKHYVPAVILSTQNNLKMLRHLKLGFKWTINWNRHQSKLSIETQKQYLHYLIDPSFKGVGTLLDLMVLIQKII